MKLGHWPKLQKFHIYSLSTPRGRNWAYFRSMGSGFRHTGRLSKLGMKLGHVGQISRSCRYTPFLPQRIEIELLFALRAAVSKIRAIFKIAIYGYDTWPLARSCTYTRFLPQGVEIELIFNACATVMQIEQFLNPRWGFLFCVCPSVCLSGVCVSVDKISQKVLNQSTSFLVAAFPVTQGRND